MSEHTVESDSAIEQVRRVLDAYWTMALEGQTPSGDWLYRKVRACVTRPGQHAEETADVPR